MKFLIILLFSISAAMADYNPSAASLQNLYKMQMNSFGVLANANGNEVSGMVYGAGVSGNRFCAVSSTAGTASSYLGSRTGTRWTVGTTPANTILFSVGFSEALDLFVGVGYVSPGPTPLILTSTDCTTWTSRTPADTTVGRSVAASPSRIVIVGSKNADADCGINYSANGTTWTAGTISGVACTGKGPFYGVVWNGSKFVAVGRDLYATSTDGITWASGNLPASSSSNSIAWDGKKFYTSTGSNAKIMSSSDGVTWSSAASFTLGHPYNITWTGKYFLASVLNPVGGIFNAAYSFNGRDWTKLVLPGYANGYATDGVRVMAYLNAPPVATDSIIRSIGLGF